MKRPILGLCLAGSLAAAGAPSAVEPWTDPALPVADGLELWLDASRLPAAAAAFSGTAPHPAAPLDAWHIDAWHDGSGHARHAAQTAWTSRPIYRRESGPVHAAPALVRFDGTNDFLSLEVPGLVFDDVTIIVAAAPRSNPGGHRGLLAFSEPGKNDHATGLNIDLGDRATDALERINVEGKGFPGQADLLAGAYNLGTLHVFTVTSSSREGSTGLRVDGKAEGGRPRASGTLGAGRIWIGARSYNITGAPMGPTGFLSADIAEILVYSRVLPESEITSLERYLESKHAGGPGAGGAPEAEILRFLVPGFLVKELPVSLTNVNDLLYLPDGRLLLLTYDGRVLVLEDTDRDGLEDRVQPFWDGAAFQSPIAMVWSGESLYVTSHGKVSSLRDTNGDGRLDREEIVLEGWVPPDVYTGLGVDALGAAMDRLGNLYVALGCADFTNPYLIRDGKARYDIRSERGTILKVSSLTREREIVSTGLRFPVSLAFNRRGDLFATDQEGETWCPGGNVLDELNHIVPGRYYGFPPRHEKHLPDVHDEPPVVAFGPQHQSTCGLLFNEEREGFLAFGPPFWEGDAFVAGFSRGKLWRVTLARTPAGHVGRSTLVASASRLLLDMAISPAGDMVIACHGGAPDWGTGPSGEGKLFKAAYSGLAAPQPVLAWTAGPLEVRVAFDRPLADILLEEAAGQGILFGENVRAGDRFEVHRPGYAAVEAQLASPTGVLAVRAVSLSEDRRTLRLVTDPHPLRARYALVLGGIRAPGDSTRGESADIDYDLGGVEAAWTASEVTREGKVDAGDGLRSWSGWLPHLDLAAARALARGTAEIELLDGLLRRRGTLALRSRIVVREKGPVLEVTSNAPFEVKREGARVTGESSAAGVRRASISLDGAGEEVEVTLRVSTGETPGRPLALHVSLQTEENPEPRAIAPERIVLPWAPARISPAAAARSTEPEKPAGDVERGEAVFFGKDVRCASCHRVRGRGGASGPDLSNLPYRDRASVLRDIAEPSASIHPDHIPHTLLLEDGGVLSGIVRADGAHSLHVVDGAAREERVDRRSVVEIRAESVSIMPGGLDVVLGPTRLQDLLAFLLSPPAKPRGLAEIEKGPPDRNLGALLNATALDGEALRQGLLASRGAGSTRAAVLSRALLRFIDLVSPSLEGRPGLDAFRPAAANLEAGIAGHERLDGATAFGAFTGRWYGVWDGLRVGHHWAEPVPLDPPQELGKKTALLARSFQYAWVGDGYGLNLIATTPTGEVGSGFILGLVVHLRDGDMAAETARRAHVGVAAGPGRLVWITAGEVFLEEALILPGGTDTYTITGFRYAFRGEVLEASEAFQAVYTRYPDVRPAYFSAPLELRVE